MMLNSLKQLNPHIKFYDVHSPEFAAFGRVITTLHFCPCEVDEAGFGCIVGLIKGTNSQIQY